MRWSLGLPVDRVDHTAEFVTGPAIAAAARAAEAAGFDAVHVTDHPAPDRRWLDGGGHHALEPMVPLAFAAAVTDRVLLHTNVYVAAYRNPFLAAKAIASLDVVSGGRALVGVAAGYLRPEFGALGVDFDERNELLDECLAVMRRVWTEDEVAVEGRHFRARGVSMLPRPVQRPHPPIWIGGNSDAAARRAVRGAQGWSPFPNQPAAVGATRTPAITSAAELGRRIAAARAHASEIGRTEPLEVCFAPWSVDHAALRRGDVGRLRDEVAALGEVGVTWLTIGFGAAEDLADWRALVDAFAAGVIGSG